MDNIVIRRGWTPGAPIIVDNLGGTAFTGEVAAHTFRIYAEGGGQLQGSVTGKLLAANGVTVPLTGSLADGEAVVTLTADCYRAAGRFVLTIYTTSGGVTLCVYCAVGTVMRADSSQVGYPSAAIPDIVALINQVQALINTIPADYSALSAHFPATGRFEAGDGQNTDVIPAHYTAAIGRNHKTTGSYSAAMGYGSTTAGNHSVALGMNNTVYGYAAQAQGIGLAANGFAQHVSGAYNIADGVGEGSDDQTKGEYIEIVGNGSGINSRSNARTLDWSGNEELAGSLKLNGSQLILGGDELLSKAQLQNLKSLPAVIGEISSEVGNVTSRVAALEDKTTGTLAEFKTFIGIE